MSVEFQDYYKTLGVSREATPEEITKAYRSLARKFHPDISKEADAEEKFKQLNEAHEVLKNEESRKRYDALGQNWKAGEQFSPPPEWEEMFGGFSNGNGSFQFSSRDFGGSGGAQGQGSGAFSDFFTSIFGGDVFPGADRGTSIFRGANMPMRGEDQRAELIVTLEDVYSGASKQITFDVVEPDASGRTTRSKRSYQFKIPPGITDGKVIRLSGQGAPGRNGGENGNLLLKVKFAKHPTYWTNGSTVLTKLPITPWEAALGAKVTVPTLGGPVSLTVPAGAQAGQLLRLKGRGLPISATEKGNMRVQLSIAVPETLSERERELMEALRDESDFNPRR